MNKKYKDVFALADICNEYPGIRPGEITLFAPVYYPIAMVEMDVVEETYSTFDPIHEIILRMKYLGVTGISGISMATGLSEGYITKIQNVLIADGQLDENGLLTAQGSESLAKEKKIIVKKNTRTFPVDSISGRIITAGNKFLNSTLEEKKDIPPYGACIVPKDGINTNVLEESLVSGDYDTIIGRKRDVKRTNLVAIEDARFAEMKYAKCHLVKCRDNDPVVFAKIFRPSEVSSYVWKPMFVFSAEQAAAFGFDDSIPVVSHARDAVYGAYTAIDERRRDLRTGLYR